MKKEIRSLTYQTATTRFLITLYESSDGKRYVAEYKAENPELIAEAKSGTAPATLKDVSSGQVRGADLEGVIAGCRAEIEKNHGPILQGI